MLSLQKHQQDAYEEVQADFEEGDKSIVIFPTGCGKSFVSLKLMEENREKKILFVAPSQPIVNQMWNYICNYLSTEETDKKIEDEEQKKERELGIKEKAQIILPGFNTILYQTIISKSKKAQELLAKLNPDYIICDEVHHVKTEKDKDVDDENEDESKEEEKSKRDANLWGEATKRFIESKNAKVLGITATPERNDGVNVAINLFDGKIASEISLIDALTSDEIPVKIPDYIPCEYTLIEQIDEKSIQEQIEIDKRANPEKAEKMQKELDEMRKIATSGKGLKDLFTENLTTEYAKSLGRDKGKYIIFCSSIEDMKQKMQEAKEWFSGVDTDPEMYAVSTKYNYSNSSGEKERNSENVISEFEDSKSDHLKLLFSVNMLDEGLHVSDISGVIMARKTNSRIKYLQQLGRGISSDEKRPVPIIFDIANNYINYDIANDAIEKLEKKIKTMQKNGDEQANLEEIDKIKEKIESFKKYKITGKMQSLVDLLNFNESNTIDEFIGKLFKLQELGVDVSKIVKKDTIETVLEKQNIDKNLAEAKGLKLDDRIGGKLHTIRSSMKGKGRCVKPTEEQVKEIETFGIKVSSEEKKDTIDEFIGKLSKLQELGVDVSKIVKKDTIETVLEKQNIDKNLAEAKGLKLDDRIGRKLQSIRSSMKGKGHCVKPTEEQVEQIEILGISVRLEKKDTIDEFIGKLSKLQELGVDVSKIVKTDTIETVLEKQNIDKNSAEAKGLKLDDRIGRKLSTIRVSMKGKGEYVKPTEEQVKKIENFGIRVRSEEKNTIDEFIGKLSKLQELGVDVSKIVTKDTIETVLEKQNIDKNSAEAKGLKLDDGIGNKISSIRKSMKGIGRSAKPTEEQVEQIEAFGIRVTPKEKISTQSIGQATYHTIVEESDKADAVVQNLVQEQERKNDKNPNLS